MSILGVMAMIKADAGISPNASKGIEILDGSVKVSVSQVCVKEPDGTLDCIPINPAQNVKVYIESSSLDPSKKIIIIKK